MLNKNKSVPHRVIKSIGASALLLAIGSAWADPYLEVDNTPDTVSGESISGESADDGAGVFIDSSVTNPFQDEFEDNSFEANVADDRGGAIYHNGAKHGDIEENPTFTDSEFIENQAGIAGGAAYVKDGTIVFKATDGETTLFTGNVANDKANGVTLDSDQDSADAHFITEGDGLIDMRDPITSTQNENGVNVTVDGTGTMALGGRSDFVDGNGNTTFNLDGGTLYLYGAGDVDNTNSAGDDVVEDGEIHLNGSGDKFNAAGGTEIVAGGHNTIHSEGDINLEDVTLRGSTSDDTNLFDESTSGGRNSELVLDGNVNVVGNLILKAVDEDDTFTVNGTLGDTSGEIVSTGDGQVILAGDNESSNNSILVDSGHFKVAEGDKFGGDVIFNADTAYEGGGYIEHVVIENGAEYLGSDAVGDATIKDGGLFAGGNGIEGTLTAESGSVVQVGRTSTADFGSTKVENYTAKDGSVTVFRVDRDGNGDQLIIVDTMDIESGAGLSFEGEAPGEDYIFVVADDFNGEYDIEDVTINGKPLEDLPLYKLEQNSDGEYTLVADFSVIAAAGDTRNQKAVASVFDDLPYDNMVFQQVLSSNGDGQNAMLDSLSGESYASEQTAMLDYSHAMRTTLSNHIRKRANSVLLSEQYLKANRDKYFRDTNLYPIWGEVIKYNQSHGGSGSVASTEYDTHGFMVGHDVLSDGGWTLGIAAGMTEGDIENSQRQAKAATKNYTGAAYLGRSFLTDKGSLNLLAGAQITHHTVDAKREVKAFDETNSASYSGNATTLFAELGHNFIVSPMLGIEPYAGYSYTHLNVSGFTEKGGDTALSVDKSSQSVQAIIAGVRFNSNFTLSNGMETHLYGGLGLQNVNGDRSGDLELSFEQAVEGKTYTIKGAEIAKKSKLFELGGGVDMTKNSRLSLDYNLVKGNDNKQRQLSLEYRYTF